MKQIREESISAGCGTGLSAGPSETRWDARCERLWIHAGFIHVENDCVWCQRVHLEAARAQSVCVCVYYTHFHLELKSYFFCCVLIFSAQIFKMLNLSWKPKLNAEYQQVVVSNKDRLIILFPTGDCNPEISIQPVDRKLIPIMAEKLLAITFWEKTSGCC